MSGSIRVLHVEDHRDIASLTAEWLERESEAISVITASGVSAGLELLDAEAVDCVVSDYELPDADGIEFLEAIRERDERLPFILFTGKGSEEVASDALAAGATDYLQKETGTDQYAVLANRIENAVSAARAVDALERQNDLHESAEEIADLGAWEYDLETGEIWLSEGGYRTLGLPESYEPGLAEAVEHYHPADRETVGTAFRAAIDDGEPFDIEVRHVAGEDRRWVRIRGDPKVTGGEVRRVRATIQDVTERVERERELERYETIVQAAGDPVYTLDADGCYTFVNDALLSVTGFEAEDLLGEHVSAGMTAESLARGQGAIRRLRTEDDCQRVTFEVRALTADGEEIPSEVHAALLPGEEFRGTVGVVRDLRDRRAREERLRRYRAMVEGVPVGVFLLDDEGTIVESNEAAASILGLDRGAWIGEPFEGLVERGIVPESAVETYVDRIRELLSDETDAEMATIQTEVHPPDAPEARTVRADVSPLPTDSEFAGAVGAYRDVTEQRAHEAALERTNRRLAELTDVLAHDLRNTMSVTNSRISLAVAALPADHGSADHLASASDAIERMDRIVDDTLTLSRQAAGVEEATDVDLAAVARRAWPAEAAGATLEIDDEIAVVGDPDRLEAALANCLENAVEHGSTSPRSSTPEDAVEHGSASPPSSSTQEDAGRASSSEPSVADAPEDAVKHGGETVTVRVGATSDGFYVADDGPGIPTDERESVREPGYTTTRDGTGFGLAIVDAVVSAHGWDLAIGESEDGGARIEVTGVDRTA